MFSGRFISVPVTALHPYFSSPVHLSPVSSKTAAPIVCARETFQSTRKHLSRRLVRKFRGANAAPPGDRDIWPLLFRKRLPCQRQLRRPRHTHNNRHHSH